MSKYRIYWKLYLNGSDTPEPDWLNNATTVEAATEAQAEAALMEQVMRDTPGCTGVEIARTEPIQEEEELFYIKARKTGNKRYGFITPNGGINDRRIHGMQYKQSHVEKALDHMRARNPGYEFRKQIAYPKRKTSPAPAAG